MEHKHKKRRSRARGVAETYIHIKGAPRNLTKEKVRIYLEEHIYAIAEVHFKGSVLLEVSIEDGSIIARVKVGGRVLLWLLATYGGMRAGIDYLVKDAHDFSDTIIENFIADELIPETSIIRAERRLGIPGKIQRFFKKLGKINSNDLSHNERQIVLDELKEEFLLIIELLEADEDREAFLVEVPDIVRPDPNIPLPRPIRGAMSFDINRNEEYEIEPDN